VDEHVMLSHLRDRIAGCPGRGFSKEESIYWCKYLDKILTSPSMEISAGLEINPIKYKKQRRDLYTIAAETGSSETLYETEDVDDPHEMMGTPDRTKQFTPNEMIEKIWKYLVLLSPLHMANVVNKIDEKADNHLKKGIAFENALLACLSNAQNKKERLKIQSLFVKLNIISAVGSRLDEVGAKYVCENLLSRKDASTGVLIGAQKFASHIISLGGLIGKNGMLLYSPTDNPQINERNKIALTNRLQRWISTSKTTTKA